MKTYRIILTICILLTTYTSWSQKLSIGYLYPAGGANGSIVEIEAGGLNLQKATHVLFNHPGISGEIVPYEETVEKRKKRKKLNDQSSPQLADKIRLRIQINSHVPCGLYDLRLQSPQGISNLLPFEVSNYPNYLESGHSTKYQPDKISTLPVVLCGQAKPGGIDYYCFQGQKDDILVASVKGRTLIPYIADAVPGWFQPVIKLTDSQGNEIAYSDDYQHQADPLILAHLPKNDTYILSIHDAIFRGREDFNYRIQLGVFPYVTACYPNFGIVGKSIEQTLEGVNLEKHRQIFTPLKEGYQSIQLETGISCKLPFYAVPQNTQLVSYPNKEILLSRNIAVADSLTQNNRIRTYKVKAQAKTPITIELIGRRNGSSIDAVIRLVDRKGNVLSETDDTEDPTKGMMTFHADPILQYTPTESTELTLQVEDIHQRAGRNYYYMLQLHQQLPSVHAFVSPANITIPAGGTSSFHVDIQGRLKGSSELILEGLPKDFTTSCLKIEKGKSWDVSITAPKEASIERIPVTLKLKYGKANSKSYTHIYPADKMMQAFYYTHHITAKELSLDITEASPYRINLDTDFNNEIEITPTDTIVPVHLLIDKDASFTDEINLELGKKNKVFELDPISVLPDEREKIIYLKVNKKAIQTYVGKKRLPLWQINIVGTVKGELIKKGKRTFQNAKYREISPFFLIKLKAQ